jgi:hypothetical protein
VNTLQSLFLLLVVAYVGGFLMGGRGERGRGLPSGSEWLVAGVVLGPATLGLLTGTELAAFWPLALLATGWIALLVGLTFGTDGDRRIPAGGLVLGTVAGALSFVAVAGAAWLALEHYRPLAALFPDRPERIGITISLGAALSDTSRHVAGWARRRLSAAGPLLDRVSDVTRSDDLIPVLVLSVIVSTDAYRGIPALPFGGVAVGAAMGLACAALLGRTLRTTTFWSLLFGFSLLATGVAEQLDVSVVAGGFALGLALAVASPLRREARELAGGVEGAVVLPALFLAGARTPMPSAPVAVLVAAVLAARLLASFAAAALVAAVDPRTRRGGAGLGLVFFPIGPLGIAIALAVGLRTPGPVADAVLAVTIAASVAGEFVGPPALRRALRRAGEIPAAAVEAPAGSAAGEEPA